MTVAGIMSGTSADGIDVAIVRIAMGAHGLKIQLLAHYAVPFSKQLRASVLNAMDATSNNAPEDRQVTVCTRNFDGQAEVSLSDTGPGIAPENLEHLFEPFFTTKTNGMGLGLAISHNIIEAHRGHMGAENNPSGGATFRITLATREEQSLPILPVSA